MCKNCGEIVEFVFNGEDKTKFCINGHSVINDFDSEVLSPKYFNNDKYCVKCGQPMKLVKGKSKYFWGCSSYPKCISYQKYVPTNKIFNKIY
jgi:ssDNA-binding Zn-finger/Zn-ribbon topoisomerase 1